MAQGQKTAPALVRDAAGGAELAALGLPLAVDPAAPLPPLPFAAPYTSMVPLVLRACRECAPQTPSVAGRSLHPKTYTSTEPLS